MEIHKIYTLSGQMKIPEISVYVVFKKQCQNTLPSIAVDTVVWKSDPSSFQTPE
jgi:hypothetical protein